MSGAERFNPARGSSGDSGIGEGVGGAVSVSVALSVGGDTEVAVAAGLAGGRVEVAIATGWVVRVAATEVASRFGGGSAAGRLQLANKKANSVAALRTTIE
jgi:hypothetical protein